jgi:holo-[acyl-carrier protein] synthase
MIIGHGIDLQEISAIEKAYNKNSKFAERILTTNEFVVFSQLKNHKRKIEFLAGRWAGKEAFSKALGTGIGQVGFKDIEILPNEKGAPYINQATFQGNVYISLTHSGNFAQASVILEENNS